MTQYTVNSVTVVFLKPTTWTMLPIEKWIDHRTSCYQNESIKATTYWNLEKSLAATDMEAGTNGLIQRLFAVV